MDAQSGTFPSGATLLNRDGRAWVLVEQPDERSLGGVLAWALQQGARSLDLLLDQAGPGVVGAMARRAGAFVTSIRVWEVSERDLIEGTATPLSPSDPLPVEAAHLADAIRAAGAEPVFEFGVLTAEVLGLEVARLVGDRLEVGVGSQDREARRLMYPDQSPAEALAETVELIRGLRRAGAPRHLANTLASERWLRAVLIAHPELVGAARLAPAPPPIPGAGLRQSRPIPAAGVDTDGRPMVVMCSTGIDLDVVPAAADARLADGRLGVRLRIAVPEGDDHRATRALAADLRELAEIVTVRPDWRILSIT
jgi:hypothetical protein